VTVDLYDGFSEYGLKYYVQDAIENGDWVEVHSTLTDLAFIEARYRSYLTTKLITDYGLALDRWPISFLEKIRKKQAGEAFAIGKHLDFLRELCAGSSVSNSCVNSVVPLTTDECKAHNDTLLEAAPDYLEVKIFFDFVSNHVSAFNRFTDLPGYTIQCAYNSAIDGPVAAQAGKLIPYFSTSALLLKAEKSRNKFVRSPPSRAVVLEGGNPGGKVEITADSKRCVTDGTKDSDFSIYEISTGNMIESVGDGKMSFSSFCITPNAEFVFLATSDNEILIWHAVKGEYVGLLSGHKEQINNMACTPDGRTLASTGFDFDIRIWDVKSQTCRLHMKDVANHSTNVEKSITGIGISADGNIGVTSSHDGTCRVWDFNTGACLRQMTAHNDISVTSDAKLAAVAEYERVIVWDTSTGDMVQEFECKTGVMRVRLSADGQILIASDSEGWLHIWNIPKQKKVKSIKISPNAHSHISMTPDAKYLMTTKNGFGHRLSLWDLELSYSSDAETSGAQSQASMDISYPRNTIFKCIDNTLYLLDLETGDQKGEFSGIKANKIKVLDAKETIVTLDYKSVQKFGMKSPSNLLSKTKLASKPNLSLVSPNDEVMVVGTDSGHVEFINLEEMKTTSSTEKHVNSVSSGCFLPDGTGFISGGFSLDEAPRLWDVNSATLLRTFEGQTNDADSIAVTPDGMCAVGVLKNHHDKQSTFALWEIKSGKRIKEISAHTGLIYKIAVSPNGQLIITGGGDGRINIWDVQTCKLIRSIAGHELSVRHLKVSPDGSTIISAGGDFTVSLWDVETGNLISAFETEDKISSISHFYANGSFVLLLGNGEHHILKLQNHKFAIPVVTPVRLWLNHKEAYDDHLSFLCPNCFSRSPIKPEIYQELLRIRKKIKPFRHNSPCLSYPHSASNDPNLTTSCTECEGAVQSTPFFVDQMGEFQPSAKKTDRAKDTTVKAQKANCNFNFPKLENASTLVKHNILPYNDYIQAGSQYQNLVEYWWGQEHDIPKQPVGRYLFYNPILNSQTFFEDTIHTRKAVHSFHLITSFLSSEEPNFKTVFGQWDHGSFAKVKGLIWANRLIDAEKEGIPSYGTRMNAHMQKKIYLSYDERLFQDLVNMAHAYKQILTSWGVAL